MPARYRVPVGGISPLGNVVVLYPNDGQPVEIPRPSERLDVGHMQRGKAGRQFDDHAAAGQLDVQGVVRIERPPIRRPRGGQNFRHTRTFWRAGADADKKSQRAQG